MSNLTDLVPPLELCKKIPAGEFADSALGYHRYCIKDGKEYYEVVQRGNTHSLTDVQYPAPTLKEIMAKLPACQCYRLGELWTIALANDSIKSGIRSGKPETAALRQYLELKQGRTVEVMVRSIGNAKCEYCGKLYRKKKKAQRFCSIKCKDKWWNRERSADSEYLHPHCEDNFNGEW
jgi:hypothetical protein